MDSQPSTIAEVEIDAGRLVMPGRQPDGWIVRYGERLQFKALFCVLSRAANSSRTIRRTSSSCSGTCGTVKFRDGG